jgi:hypothetical protein
MHPAGRLHLALDSQLFAEFSLNIKILSKNAGTIIVSMAETNSNWWSSESSSRVCPRQYQLIDAVAEAGQMREFAYKTYLAMLFLNRLTETMRWDRAQGPSAAYLFGKKSQNVSGKHSLKGEWKL